VCVPESQIDNTVFIFGRVGSVFLNHESSVG